MMSRRHSFVMAACLVSGLSQARDLSLDCSGKTVDLPAGHTVEQVRLRSVSAGNQDFYLAEFSQTVDPNARILTRIMVLEDGALLARPGTWENSSQKYEVQGNIEFGYRSMSSKAGLYRIELDAQTKKGTLTYRLYRNAEDLSPGWLLEERKAEISCSLLEG